MNLVVKRSKWLRGAGPNGDSYLLHPTNRRMCCLGFLARAVGYKPCEIKGTHTPAYVKDPSKFPAAIVSGDDDNTLLCDDMMDTNDSATLNDTQREYKLTRLFKKADIAITFVD